MPLIQALAPALSSSAVADQNNLPHVLLVLDQFPKTLGGGERVVLRLAALLPRYGYRVSILTFAVHAGGLDLNAAPCPIYLLPLTRTYDLQALRSGRELGRFLQEQKIKIVQTFFESSDIWAGFVTKALSDAKLIWSRRDMGILRSPKHSVAYRLMASRPDAVLAVSEQVRRHAIEVDRIEPGRVTTIYNGLDVMDGKPAAGSSTDTRERIVTTVGNIRRVKGHDVLIQAAATVVKRFPDVRFSIAGEVLEAEYFEQLQGMVRDLGLADRFQFVGGIKDLRAHLQTAELFVLPSRSEGFSNAIVEAMAASLPVVATDVGGNGEAIEDGVTGVLVAPGDVSGLADAIVRVLADPAAAHSMGAAGRQRVLDHFTTEAMMTRLTGIYADVLTR